MEEKNLVSTEASVMTSMASIVDAADQPDDSKRYYDNGRLYVVGVEQSALDAAIGAGD